MVKLFYRYFPGKVIAVRQGVAKSPIAALPFPKTHEYIPVAPSLLP